MMFSNQSFETVSFNSQLSLAKSERLANVQTVEIVYTVNDTQTVEKKNAATQTMNELQDRPNIDYDKLAEFLRKVSPAILEELDKTHETNAFDDYDPTTSEEFCANIEIVQKICTVQEPKSQVKVSDLSWGAGGGTLAVSHSILYHETWCDHLSKIQIYNFNREKFSEVSNKSLEVNSCVTALVYHPTEPSIIAAGLFNGDVLVWNLRDENSITPIQVCTHLDSISQLYWMSRTINDVSHLVSSSKDGFIYIHKLLANFTTVRQHKCFKVIKEHNPAENSRPRSASGTRERAVEAGLCITAFDYSHKDPTIFIVGTGCGGIYKCSENQITPIEGDEAILDPVIDEYERHIGSVTCIKCSSTRNIFVTSSTDKEIRVYEYSQHVSQRAVLVDETVIGLTWMIGNRDIFAAYGANAKIQFFDLPSVNYMTHINLEPSSKEGTTSLRVNSKRDVIAIGDASGNVEIWKVPRQLF